DAAGPTATRQFRAYFLWRRPFDIFISRVPLSTEGAISLELFLCMEVQFRQWFSRCDVRRSRYNSVVSAQEWLTFMLDQRRTVLQRTGLLRMHKKVAQNTTKNLQLAGFVLDLVVTRHLFFAYNHPAQIQIRRNCLKEVTTLASFFPIF